MKLNACLIRSTIVAALGGLLFGFDTAVISGTEARLQELFDLSKGGLGFTVSSALIGTMLGAFVIGRPTDRFGRRTVLLWMAIFYTISALGCGLAPDWYSLLFFRFIGGIAVGGASVVSPMYIAEISPAKIRGFLVCTQQFNVCFGICLAYVSNYIVASCGLVMEAEQWRWMFGVEAIPAAAFFVLLYTIPRSPRWLIEKQRVDEARDVFVKLGAENVETEVAEVIESLHNQFDVEHEPLFQPKYKFPIIAAVMLAVFNQLTGINALLYYAPQVFSMGGADGNAALLQSIPIGVSLVISTVVGMLLMDRFGRKTLLMVGSVGMVVFLGLVAWTFYTIADPENIPASVSRNVMYYFIGYILFFGFSQGAVIWVFISEIFPNKVRAKGQSLGSFTHWAMAAVVSQIFPVAAHTSWIGPGNCFAFFSAMMVAHFLFVWFVLPETKGISLEKIQKNLGIE